MQRICLASNNAKKVRELRQRLDALPVEIAPQGELGVSEAEETGLSFVENAILKARHASRISGLPAIADDSGLEVDALRGAPGIYSARYSGPGATDERNNAKLLQALADVPQDQRTARFQCLLVYMRHAEDPTPLICQGTWEGRILTAPSGEGGFGYDPLFFAPEAGKAAAELAPEQKIELSHRGKALTQLVRALQQRL